MDQAAEFADRLLFSDGGILRLGWVIAALAVYALYRGTLAHIATLKQSGDVSNSWTAVIDAMQATLIEALNGLRRALSDQRIMIDSHGSSLDAMQREIIATRDEARRTAEAIEAVRVQTAAIFASRGDQ